jgi:PAS domain S-box-containing protein
MWFLKGSRMLPDFADLPDGIVFSDMQGQVQGFSPSTMTMFRYATDQEQTGRRVTDFLVPEDRARAAGHFSRRLLGEEPGLKHYRGLRADGSTFPIEVNGQTILGADGQPKEVLFIIRDLSGRRGMEQKLEKTAQLLQAAFRVAGMGQIITNLQDPTWPWACSPGVDEMLGIDLDFEKNLEGWATLLHPEDRDRVLSQVRESVQQHQPFSEQFRIIRPTDGELRWIAAWADTQHDEDSKPLQQIGILQDITTSKQAELAVAESEARFRTWFRLPLVGIAVSAPSKGWLEVNDHLCTMLGYRPEELRSMTWAEITHPEDLASDETQFERVLQGNLEGYSLEKRFVRKDGSIQPSELSTRSVRRPDGKVDYMVTLVQDISERRKAEEALRTSEAMYRELLERQGEGFGVLDEQERFVLTNPVAEQIFGAAPGSLVGRSLMEFLSKDQQERIRQETLLRAQGTQSTYDLQIRRDDGTPRSLLITATPAAHHEGKALQVIGVFRDVTEQKQTENALLEAHQHLESLVSAIPGVVYQFLVTPTREWKFLYVSEGIQDLYGVPPEAALRDQNALSERIHPEDRACHRQAVMDAARDFKFWAHEHRIITPNGQMKWVRAYAQPVRQQDGGVLWNGVLLDWTDRKLAEEEKLHLQHQLQQAQKMESLGSLAGGVAHDMNNVLGAILGLASAQIGSQPYGSPLHKALDTICKATERGGKMVKGLLSFARQAPTEESRLDLNAILSEQVTLLERTTLAKVRLQLNLQADLHPILGDASALAHAFMNLCVNAVDAMPDKGTLTLHTRNVDYDWVEVVVEDNGIGMPKGVLEKAMDPFFTTKEVGKGTGLGLSMVFSTVTAHQGQIELQSEPGQGTRVMLRFPACQQEPQPPTAEPVVAEQTTAPQGGLKVLLVDDDDLILSAIQMLLEVMGHRVHIAPSGEEALGLLEAGFAPDLVILDMNMPGLGGAGTLPRLRGLCPEVPVLLSTGRADRTALTLASAHPGVTLMSKPFGLRELQTHLESIGLG